MITDNYTHEQTGEIKTLLDWKAIYEEWGISGFEDFEAFKSEWLTLI